MTLRGWCRMKLVNITKLCNIEIGKTPSRNEMTYWGTGVNWVSIRDMKEKYILDTKEEITTKAISETGIKIVPKNTVIMSFKLSVGKVAIVGKDVYTNEAIAAFHILDESKLYNKYLYYALETLRLTDNTDRAVMGLTLNKQKLKQINIPVPLLETQKKIVEILDKAQGLIDARKEQIKLMDDLIQSVFYEMFGDPVTNPKGWEVRKLGEIGSLERGKSKHRPRNAPELLGGKYPLVQTGDISNAGLYIYEYSQTYSELGLQQSKIWDKGTLCVTIAANIARTSILGFDACFPDSIVAFIPNENVESMYVQIWFGFLQKIIEANAPESAQKNINLKILRDLDIPLPDIYIQKNFCKVIDMIEAERKLLNTSLIELENNYHSMMKKSFGNGL